MKLRQFKRLMNRALNCSHKMNAMSARRGYPCHDLRPLLYCKSAMTQRKLNRSPGHVE